MKNCTFLSTETAALARNSTPSVTTEQGTRELTLDYIYEHQRSPRKNLATFIFQLFCIIFITLFLVLATYIFTTTLGHKHAKSCTDSIK